MEKSTPPEERLINRDDLEDTVFRNLSAARMRSYEQVQEWFVELATHDNIQLCTASEALHGSSSRFYSFARTQPATTPGNSPFDLPRTKLIWHLSKIVTQGLLNSFPQSFHAM
jgi:hypothetical protein